MPRRSDADLSLVPMLPGKGRPAPPKALDQIQARAWNDVVDALPDRFLDPVGQLVLRRTGTQVAIAERLEERLRRWPIWVMILRPLRPRRSLRQCIARRRRRL